MREAIYFVSKTVRTIASQNGNPTLERHPPYPAATPVEATLNYFFVIECRSVMDEHYLAAAPVLARGESALKEKKPRKTGEE